MDIEESSHVKAITYLVLRIYSTPSTSYGSTSPIHCPGGPYQSPKATKISIKITKSCLASLFNGKEVTITQNMSPASNLSYPIPS